MEIRSAPRLFGRRLRNRGTARRKLIEKPLHVGDLGCRQDERNLSRREFGKIGIVNTPQVQARLATGHRAIERRIAMEKVNVEPEFVPVECCADWKVPNE